VENEDGALLDGEPSEGSIELIAIVHSERVVEPVHGLGGYESDACGPARAMPGLGIAGVGQDPMEPRLEEASRKIRNAIPMQRSPTIRASESNASASPRLAWSTSVACTQSSDPCADRSGWMRSEMRVLGAAYLFNLDRRQVSND